MQYQGQILDGQMHGYVLITLFSYLLCLDLGNSSMTMMSTTKESGTAASDTVAEFMFTWMVMNSQASQSHRSLGSKFDGIWENDRINGEGTSWYPNGNRYQGDWSNGRINGRGVTFFLAHSHHRFCRHSLPCQRR
jgi:hypothetical protein